MIDRDQLGIICAEHGRIALYTDPVVPARPPKAERTRIVAWQRREAAERKAIEHLRSHHPELLVRLAGMTLTQVPRAN